MSGKREHILTSFGLLFLSVYLNYIYDIYGIISPLSSFESKLGWFGILGVSFYLGMSSVIEKKDDQDSSLRSIIYDKSGETNGIALNKAAIYSERQRNFPASVGCLRKIKSYQVLSHVGGVLTLVAIGIFLIYIFSEVRVQGDVIFAINVITTVVLEAIIVKAIISRHDSITQFTGYTITNDIFVYRNFWKNAGVSLVNIITGMSFLSFGIFLVITVGYFSQYLSHPDVLTVLQYMIAIPSFTSGIGWVGTGIYQILPHISGKYANFNEPDIGEALLTEIEEKDNGKYLLKNQSEE